SRIGTPRNDWPIYYNTIKTAGFETIVPYLALLEENNPKLLMKLIEEPETIRQMVTRRARYMLSPMRWEFIIMQSEDSEINTEYRDYGVEMYVLNKERYKSAFDIFHYLPKIVDRSKINIMPEMVDWNKVNSIMRPILPSRSPFRVKVP
ncbi:hypothetical protein ACFLVC_05265, partial [Chloroflexota bacterium]